VFPCLAPQELPGDSVATANRASERHRPPAVPESVMSVGPDELRIIPDLSSRHRGYARLG
jgi:hypothetical protein